MLGMQFAEVALLEIPKHGYFYASRHAPERKLHSQNALRVTQQLLRLLLELQPTFDNAASSNMSSDWERVSKLKALAEEQVAAEHGGLMVEEVYEHDRQQLETEFLETANVTSTSLLCGDIMEYAEMLCPGRRTIAEEPTTTEYYPKDADMPLHPLLAPPPPLPNTSGTSMDDLQRALLVSGGMNSAGDSASSSQHSRAPSSSGPASRRRKRSVPAIDMASLQMCYHEDFCDLRSRGRVRVSQASTYQGKLPGSINGCTVIAPLLCVHHFHNNWDDSGSQYHLTRGTVPVSHDDVTTRAGYTNNNGGKDSEQSKRSARNISSIKKKDPDAGLLDAVISEVIDFETPAILPQVREMLGLTKDALIIPSDVHDFLIDKQLLSSEQFVTVAGGNILDDRHVTEFVNQLLVTEKNGDCKLAATFFFHEHVIAILRLQRSDTEVWFDLIDSLPNAETLRKVGEQQPQPPQFDPYAEYFIEETPPNASRIRCTDEESLKVAIKWFACSRFTDDNKQYIDMYAWDELYTDFDPRVFQAFIWAEMI
jgi:hypothetical protein